MLPRCAHGRVTLMVMCLAVLMMSFPALAGTGKAYCGIKIQNFDNEFEVVLNVQRFVEGYSCEDKGSGEKSRALFHTGSWGFAVKPGAKRTIQVFRHFLALGKGGDNSKVCEKQVGEDQTLVFMGETFGGDMICQVVTKQGSSWGW